MQPMDSQELRQKIAGYANRQLAERKTWYSPAANAYNQARPDYPAPLVEQVLNIAQLSATSAVLEVGCGPGTATVSFAPFVGSMECVEPNPDFADLAQQNCQPFPNVAIKNTSFEEWPMAEGQFDAVLAATSFHWIPAEIGYPKAARALKENGHLILLWNKELQPSYEIYQRLSKVYQNHSPSLARYEDRSTQAKILNDLGSMMTESGHFQTVVSNHTSTEVTYTSSEYLTLLATYSPYIALKAKTRQSLFKDLKTLLDQEFEGRLQLSYTSAFHIATKA